MGGRKEAHGVRGLSLANELDTLTGQRPPTKRGPPRADAAEPLVARLV